MNQVDSEKFIETFIYYENYEDYGEDHLYYIFTKEIAKLSGEGELLPHHEFSINYDEKFCIFNDFEIDYEAGEKIYTTTYKIILSPSLKKLYSLFNIFIFIK